MFEECVITNNCTRGGLFDTKAYNCYNCTEGAQQVAPNCPFNKFDIAQGLDSCCNNPMECKGNKTQDELPDDCSVPADLPSKATSILSEKLPEDVVIGPKNKDKKNNKKNAPWKKRGKGSE